MLRSYKKTGVIVFLCYLSFLSCFSDIKKEQALFKAIALEHSNIDFINKVDDNDSINIMDYLYYYNGAGVGIGDINQDSLPDIYFVSNRGKNKLYLNKGNFIFQDISQEAMVGGNSNWQTGVSMLDINQDGWVDIYVCAVTGLHDFYGHNELYINQKDGTFKEESKKYGLDIANYSSQAVFFDYDLDGDLDMYLLNHAVHTVHSFGNAKIREKRDRMIGDKLLENRNGKFIDVSQKAGIYGGINGYGLGVGVSDFNNDGFPDIYVGNDFQEDDYIYINNQKGGFKEMNSKLLGHTSRFTMGLDIADINNDSYTDILTLDMLAEEEEVQKASVGDENITHEKLRTQKYGYQYQYARNMLQINRAGQYFSEMGLLSGIAATDWSWAPIIQDFDLDGHKDIFISNGIVKRPNDLDYLNYISNETVNKTLQSTKFLDKKALALMPYGGHANYFFKGLKDLGFIQLEKALPKMPAISNAVAYADLDLDGDLDLVTNNINAHASILENRSSGNFLKITLTFLSQNIQAIGTKLILYHNKEKQYQELYTQRGFQSSVQPIIVFGLGSGEKIDSLQVIWPDRTFDTFKDIPVNQHISLKPSFERKQWKERGKNYNIPVQFQKVEGNLGLDYIHKENIHEDFNVQKLLPFRQSDKGPASAVGDLNGDKKDDLFFGASKHEKASIYLQTAKGFEKQKNSTVESDYINEDVDAVSFDFDSDGKNDLWVASAGGQFTGKKNILLNRLYRNDFPSALKKIALPKAYMNASVISACDFDLDGDLDVFVGAESQGGNYGAIMPSYLFINNGNGFHLSNSKGMDIGMVNDALWIDVNNDGWKDLIVVGEWMSPTIFENQKGKLVNKTRDYIEKPSLGLWQSIIPFDIDGDNDMDIILGNWGLNSKFVCSPNQPITMYYGDFDNNGKSETLISHYKRGKQYPIHSIDELKSQLNYLQKKILSYKKTAGKTFHELFGDVLKKSKNTFKITQLSSGYLENNDGRYKFKAFPQNLQTAPIATMLKYDFNQDGKESLLLAGNYFGLSPYHGKLDAFGGALIENKNSIYLGHELGLDLFNKMVKKMHIVFFKNKAYLLVVVNSGSPEIYEFK